MAILRTSKAGPRRLSLHVAPGALLIATLAGGMSLSSAASGLDLVNDRVLLREAAACSDPSNPGALPAGAGVPGPSLPGRLLVAFREGVFEAPRIVGHDRDGCALTGIAAIDSLGHALSVRGLTSPYRRAGSTLLSRVGLLLYDAPVEPLEAARAMAAHPDVLWAEPDYLRRVDLFPSDSSFSTQWYLQMVEAPDAWDLETGDPGAVIAVIDTGVEFDHPDLAANIWVNTVEDQGTAGVDDDGNGFVDDVIGWDFVDVAPWQVATGEDPGPPDPNPRDRQGHGTSVAGVVAAVANNTTTTSSNVAGICWHCRIMALRAGYRSSATGAGVIPASASAGAILYAADNGARIINMSYSSTALSLTEESAVAYAVGRGVLPVAAAGNIRDPNTAGNPVYPAASSGVLAVAATDRLDTKALFSKYGTYVDLSAPGSQIFTTGLAAGHVTQSGTSFSSPLVAGMAGLVLSARPGLVGEDLADLLKASAVNIDARNLPFQGLLGDGRVDAFAAMVAHRIALENRVTDPNTPSDTFSITGIQDDPNATWLSFPASLPLAVAPGVTAFLDAAVEEAETECGFNEATVTVTTDDATAPSIQVPVRLRLDCDGDRDGFLCSARGGLDCDDTSAKISPVEVEICDGSAVCLGLAGVDDNCDGQVDEICSCTGKPNAPELISVGLVSGPAVKLVWRDLSNNERAVKILRKRRPGGSWRRIARLNPDSEVFVDSSVKRGKRYIYAVKVFAKKGGKGRRVVSREVYIP